MYRFCDVEFDFTYSLLSSQMCLFFPRIDLLQIIVRKTIEINLARNHKLYPPHFFTLFRPFALLMGWAHSLVIIKTKLLFHSKKLLQEDMDFIETTQTVQFQCIPIPSYIPYTHDITFILQIFIPFPQLKKRISQHWREVEECCETHTKCVRRRISLISSYQ